jgi:hypothetical protein
MSVPSGVETAVVMQASCLLIRNRPQGASKVCLQQARFSGAVSTEISYVFPHSYITDRLQRSL